MVYMFIFLFFILSTFHLSASDEPAILNCFSYCFSQPAIKKVYPEASVDSGEEINLRPPLILRKKNRGIQEKEDIKPSLSHYLSNQSNREDVRNKMKKIDRILYGNAITCRVYELDQDSLGIKNRYVKRIVMNLCRERISSSSTSLEDLGNCKAIDIQRRMNNLSEDSAFHVQKIAAEEHAKSIVSFIEQESQAILLDYQQRIPGCSDLKVSSRDVFYENIHMSLFLLASKKHKDTKKRSQEDISSSSSIGARTRNFFNDVCNVEQSVVCNNHLTKDILKSDVDDLSLRYGTIRPTLSERAKSFADQSLKSINRSLESFEEN